MPGGHGHERNGSFQRVNLSIVCQYSLVHSNTNSLRFFASAIAVSMLAGPAAVLTAPAANAAPSANGKAATTLVLYAENRGIARIENNAPGPDNSDLVHRELALSFTLKGPIIGVAYSQAEIVAYNPEAKTDIRRVDIENALPGGWLFIAGMTKLAIGTLPQPGWTDSYAVVGGTGKYVGARGSERLTLLEDGKTYKVVITLLPK